MVTLSSIPSSTTKMLDVELSPNDGSEEVLEDSNDEAIIKTRVSNFEGASSEEELDVTTIGMVFFLCPSFFFSYSLYTFFSLPCISPCHVGTEVFEKQEVASVPTKPTPIGPSKLTFLLFPCYAILAFFSFCFQGLLAILLAPF